MICSSRFCTKKKKEKKLNIMQINVNKKKNTSVCQYSLTIFKNDQLDPYLKPFVLQNFLNCHHLATIHKSCLINHAKRTIADDFDIRIRHLLRTVWSLTWRGHYSGYFSIVSCEEGKLNLSRMPSYSKSLLYSIQDTLPSKKNTPN